MFELYLFGVIEYIWSNYKKCVCVRERVFSLQLLGTDKPIKIFFISDNILLSFTILNCLISLFSLTGKLLYLNICLSFAICK